MVIIRHRCFLCCSLRLVDAQGVGASGSLRGVVADLTGASMPKAAVTVTDTRRGTKLAPSRIPPVSTVFRV